jgi:hypothetical protein
MILVRTRGGSYASVLSLGSDTLIDRLPQRGSDAYGQSDWALSGHKTDLGTLSVLTRKRSRVTQQLSGLGEPNSKRLATTEEEEVTTSVSLLLAHAQARRAIKVRVRQTYNDNGVFSAIPHLMVYNILSANSPVFDIVRRGRLQEFQALLRDGKASLRDQDEYGASLLFVSGPCNDGTQLLIVPFSMQTGNPRCVGISFSQVQT